MVDKITVDKERQTDSACVLTDTKSNMVFEYIKGKHSINSSSNLVQTALEPYFDVHRTKICEE